MSAIGDYIHYSARGYQEHGTTVDGAFNAWSSQKNIIKNRVQSSSGQTIDKKSLKEFETLLNDIQDGSNDKSELVKQKTLKVLQEQFENSLGEIDWSSWDVKGSNSKKGTVAKIKKEHKIKTVKKRIEELERIIEEAKTITGKDSVYTRGHLTKIRKIKSAYNALTKELSETDQAEMIQGSFTLKGGDTWDFSKIRKEVNGLISQYAAVPALNLQKGDLFENMIAYAPLAAKSVADRALGEVLGKEREVVSFNKTNFSGAYITEEFENGVLNTSASSQGKVDVHLNWQGQDLKISAKNVNLGNGDNRSWYIHLLSGSSLLYLLQDVDGDFVNHFLNLCSVVDKTGASGALAQSKVSIINEVKLILMYKALTGDNYKRQAANIFAVNDNASGRIRLFTMGELVDKIIASGNSSNAIYEKGITMGQSGSTFNAKLKFNNTWVGGDNNPNETDAQKRISAVLSDAHSKKINVSIHSSFIKSLW